MPTRRISIREIIRCISPQNLNFDLQLTTAASNGHN